MNRFNPSVSVSLAKIEKLLRLTSGQMSKIGEDSSGYITAAQMALPYIQNNGRFRQEYETLREKIAPFSTQN